MGGQPCHLLGGDDEMRYRWLRKGEGLNFGRAECKVFEMYLVELELRRETSAGWRSVGA